MSPTRKCCLGWLVRNTNLVLIYGVPSVVDYSFEGVFTIPSYSGLPHNIL